jgi:integrase
MFEAEEVRAMLHGALVVGEVGPKLVQAGAQLKAMVLLGVNAGLGNTDIASLEMRHLDLDGGWLNFPRVKTGIERRCSLWPETIAALRAVLALRKPPKDPQHNALVFFTKYHQPWVRTVQKQGADGKAKVTFDDAVAKEMKKLLVDLGMARKGLNFYALRHTFQTIGEGAHDPVAVGHIMGHADQSMASAYRERISDGRLQLVTHHVHGWLFAEPSSPDILPLQSPKTGTAD